MRRASFLTIRCSSSLRSLASSDDEEAGSRSEDESGRLD